MVSLKRRIARSDDCQSSCHRGLAAPPFPDGRLPSYLSR